MSASLDKFALKTGGCPSQKIPGIFFVFAPNVTYVFHAPLLRRPPATNWCPVMKLDTSHRKTVRDGAALVEFAMVVPVFFVFFFGMVEIARAFMAKSLLDNAARVGCRTGILQGKSNADIQSAITAALTGQGISGTSSSISVNGKSADVSTASTGDTVTVSVSVPVANITWLPGAGYLAGTLRVTCSLPHV